MITGSLSLDGAPFIGIEIQFPRLDLAFRVRALVDTGAEATTISARDWMVAGLNWQQLDPASEYQVAGFGGAASCRREFAAIVLFHEDQHADIWHFPVDLSSEDSFGSPVPSVLGRDILSRYRVLYSVPELIVALDEPPMRP